MASRQQSTKNAEKGLRGNSEYWREQRAGVSAIYRSSQKKKGYTKKNNPEEQNSMPVTPPHPRLDRNDELINKNTSPYFKDTKDTTPRRFNTGSTSSLRDSEKPSKLILETIKEVSRVTPRSPSKSAAPPQRDPKQTTIMDYITVPDENDQRPTNSVTKTKNGFKNLGNTCYMNSVLRSIISLPPFVVSIKSNPFYQQDTKTDAPILTSVTKLTDEIQEQNKRVLNPKDIKQSVGDVVEQFAGYDQQDAHEFLWSLMNGIEEEVNKMLHKSENPEPNFELPQLPPTPDSEFDDPGINLNEALTTPPSVEDDILKDPFLLDADQAKEVIDLTNSQEIISVSSNQKTEEDSWPSETIFEQIEEEERLLNNRLRLEAEQKSKQDSKRLLIETIPPAQCPIINNFTFQVEHNLACLHCGKATKIKEEFRDFSIEITNFKQSVQQLISQYLDEDCVVEKNCEECSKTNARLTHKLLNSPTILVIHLKRFRYDPVLAGFKKILDKAEVNKHLDLTEFSKAKAARRGIKRKREAIEIIDGGVEKGGDDEEGRERERQRKIRASLENDIFTDVSGVPANTMPVVMMAVKSSTNKVLNPQVQSGLKEAEGRSVNKSNNNNNTNNSARLRSSVNSGASNSTKSVNKEEDCMIEDIEWVCERCTFKNEKQKDKCEICEMVRSEEESPWRYTLVSSVCHSGTLSSGHYTCDVYNPESREWRHWNDESSSDLKEETALTGNREESGYLFFYVKNTCLKPVA